MSKNHPNDNIYSILGKLDALSPKEQPAQEAPKKIYESVEARGSIMSGVTRLEKKLSEQYAADKKALDTNPKNDKYTDAWISGHKRRLGKEKNRMSMQRRVSGMDTGQPPAVQESLIDDDSTDIRELLNFNLFRDYESFKDGDIDPASYSPEEIQAWEQLFAAWGPVADQLERQINKAAAKGAVLTPEQNQEINDNWYDGSDAYDDPLRELPGIYGREIPIIRKILRQSTKVKEGIAEGSAHGYNVAKWYEKNGDQLKLTRWLRKEAGLPNDAPVYFDDADLVYGDKTIVSSALVNPKLKFNDLLTALTQATGGQGKQGVAEDAAPVKYGVFSTGGSVGSQRFKDDPIKTFDDKEKAKEFARERRKGLSKGERGYYRMGYVVKAIKGLAEGSTEFNKIKTTPYKANQMLAGKDPVAFVIEVLCPDQSVVNMIQSKVGTAYQIERDDSIEGNGIGIEIISQRFEGGRTAQAAYKQILDIIKQSGGQFNDSTEVTIARQTQGVTEASRGFRGVGGARDREDDERHDLDPSDWYIVKDGKLLKASIYPRQEAQAREEGFSPTREEARSKASKKGVAEGKWNYPSEYTKKANADDEAELGVSLINKDARKEWRKKQKAKAHKDLMTGKKKEQDVAEGWGDMEADVKRRDAERRSGKKATATGVKHHGKYGTEYQGDSDSEDDNQHQADKGTRKRGRPAKGTPKKASASTEKKGVGRPKKAAAPTYGGAAGLQSFFGSTAPKKSKVKGKVHKMDESRMMDESKNTFQHILNRFKHEVKKFEEGEPIEYGSDLFHALYDYYVEAGEMPYGIQKARTGMPDEWISDRLEQDLGISGTSLSHMSAPAHQPDPDMDHELNELARLAGLTVSETKIKMADQDYDNDGRRETEKAEVIGSHRRAAGLDDEQLDEGMCESCNCKPCECNEGNAFGKAIRAAKADGVQPGEKVRVGDKDYAVREAQELSAMLRVAGINTDQIDEAIKSVTEGSMKRWLEGLAMQLDKSDFVANADEYGMTPREAAEWWNNCNGVEYSDKYSPRNGPEENDNDHDYYNRLDSEQYDDESFDESIPVHKHVDGPFDPNWTPGDDEGETCPECDGEGCPECYSDEHRDRAHDYAQGMERESLGMDEEANSPDEDYYSIKGSTMGPGEGDAGEKNMYGGPGDNRMTQQPTRPAKPVTTLEARLAAEYESIKKVSNEGIMGRVGGAIKNAIGKKATRPVSGPGSAPNVFDVEPYKSDTKAYLKKSAKQPNGPSNVKNIFDK